jgi:hypothetical protein
MKGLIPSIIGGIIAAWLLTVLADAARESALSRMLEHGYPKLSAGDAPVMVRRVDLEPGKSFLFQDYSDFPQALLLNGWTIRLPSAPFPVSYDDSCGMDCVRALTSGGMLCEASLGTFESNGSSACELHVWEDPDGKQDCFFSLDTEIKPTQTIPGIVMRLPRELHFQCPVSLGWVPG